MVRRYLKDAKLKSQFDISNQFGVDEDDNVMCRLGHKLVKKRLYEEAVTVYEAILEHDSGRLSIIERLAKCYVVDGKHEQALRVYETRIEKDPMCFPAWHGLCKVYLVMGDVDHAITKICQNILEYPGIPSPMMLLSNLYSTKGDYKNAILTYMKAWDCCGSDFR
jgi:tetratricopeptide (TPR) repeat protein